MKQREMLSIIQAAAVGGGGDRELRCVLNLASISKAF